MSPFRPSTPTFTKADAWKKGTAFALEAPGPQPPRLAVFEDNGETGYFYAVDAPEGRSPEIVDGVFLYTVDPEASQQEDIAEVRWSADGERAVLLLGGIPEAAFDFGRQRGYGRTSSPSATNGPWPLHEHVWDASVLAGLE